MEVVSGFPSFPLLNAALAPLGFVGGAEIKLLSVFLVAISGITAYLLSRSLGLGFFSSFLAGLFFMTTAVVFDWLMFGWIYYLIAYALLPLMILVTKKILRDKRFTLCTNKWSYPFSRHRTTDLYSNLPFAELSICII